MSPTSPPTLVSDVMTSKVQTAGPSDELHDIWRMLEDRQCHHIPIVESGRPIGMVSTRDLIRVARKHGAAKLSTGLYGSERARDIMSTDLETVGVDESVEVAIERIGRGDIHALVVLGADEGLAGIVTNHDLLHYLLS